MTMHNEAAVAAEEEEMGRLVAVAVRAELVARRAEAEAESATALLASFDKKEAKKEVWRAKCAEKATRAKEDEDRRAQEMRAAKHDRATARKAAKVEDDRRAGEEVAAAAAAAVEAEEARRVGVASRAVSRAAAAEAAAAVSAVGAARAAEEASRGRAEAARGRLAEAETELSAITAAARASKDKLERSEVAKETAMEVCRLALAGVVRAGGEITACGGISAAPAPVLDAGRAAGRSYNSALAAAAIAGVEVSKNAEFLENVLSFRRIFLEAHATARREKVTAAVGESRAASSLAAAVAAAAAIGVV
jgi:hypothetical protein